MAAEPGARMTIRCSPLLHERVMVEAKARGLSLNDAVIGALERWLEAPEEPALLIRLIAQDAHMARELLEMDRVYVKRPTDIETAKERTKRWIERIRQR